MKIKNPWLSIWVKPRTTFKQTLSVEPTRTIIPLTIFNGILGAIIWLIFFWKEAPEGRRDFTPLFFVSNIVMGIIISLIVLYLGSLLLKWTGHWIGGKGKYTYVKCAFGWTNYPMIVSNIFGLISALLYPRGFIPFEVLKVIFIIWAIVILIYMLSEAHQFSVWKGLLAFIIAAAIAFVVVMAIGFIVGGITALFTR